MTREIGLAAALALTIGIAAPSAHAITIQGESPADTNIPTAAHPEASGRRYLALATRRDPPSRGWYAEYAVDAPAAGIYRLDAVITPPALADREPLGGSPFDLSVNGAPFAQVARSETSWAETSPAWGALARARIDDVELRRGRNTIAFRVDERRVAAPPTGYHFSLDELTLTPTPLALKDTFVGDPARNVGTYRGDERATLRFRLNGHAPEPRTVDYAVTDYFGSQVASGTATIHAGATTTGVDLRPLPTGYFRVRAALASTTAAPPPDRDRSRGSHASAPGATVEGSFAHLPERRPVAGRANRFGVTTSAPWLIPSSRRAAVAEAFADMGAGYAREEILWPAIEERRGAYDTRGVDGVAQAFRRSGVKTLGALWALQGNLSAPDWALTEASAPLPADLRDAYDLTHHLAGRRDGIGRDAIEVWNEPDVDVLAGELSRTTGDQHAAYVKAATLGIADRPNRPLAALSGIAFPGDFQQLMLQNDVARYADVWSFHGYPEEHVPGGLSPFPPAVETEHGLRRLYGARTQMWMTESGIFARGPENGPALQADQARYLVQSTVQSLAAGTDKQFWFSGPPYGKCESEWGCFGLLSRDFQPWPGYSAHAAMASILGEARFAGAVDGLPPKVSGYVFEDRGRAVTVVWAQSPTQVSVPVPGRSADVHDVMGARRAREAPRDGKVRVAASLDPIYLVSDAPSGLRTNDVRTRAGGSGLSRAEHIVLAQRFAADARPTPPPHGYRLDARARMSLDVYNFDDRAQTVTVRGHAYGGWSAKPAARTTVRIPARGRVTIPFTIAAGPGVRPGTDYPLAFEATLGRRRVPPSVSRIQRKGPEGEPLPLAPVIDEISPADGSTVTGPEVNLTARIADRLSSVDPARVDVEVDGHRVPGRFQAGRLTSSLRLRPGRHEIWIRAYNNAHAPTQASVEVTVR